MVESDHVTGYWTLIGSFHQTPVYIQDLILITSRRPNPDTRTCKLPEYENTGPGIIADTIIAIILTTLNVRCELGLMRPLLMVMLTDTPGDLIVRIRQRQTDNDGRQSKLKSQTEIIITGNMPENDNQ